MSKILGAAVKWRKEHPEHVCGVVLVWENEAYGWKDKLRNPEQEQPSAYAVDNENNVFIATGGNDYDGAKCWVVSTA